MLSCNNYIYTNIGIVTVDSLYKLYKNNEELPLLLTFDTTTYTFSFTNIAKVIRQPEVINNNANNYVDIYDCNFVDIYSTRNVKLNCTKDTQIFQYNTLQTDNSPIINKNIQVISYLKNNSTKTKLNAGWKIINNLYNYSTHMCNLCLGDTVMRYVSKCFKEREVGYSILNNNNESIPLFASMTKSTFYNFVFIK